MHAYTAGNEPYSLWEGLDRRGKEYKMLKASLLGSQRSTVAALRQDGLINAVQLSCSPLFCWIIYSALSLQDRSHSC